MVRIDKIPQRLTCILDDLIDYAFKSVSPVENGLPVIITGAPRSATTTVEEIFNSNKVFLYHEPFLRNTILWNSELAKAYSNQPFNSARISSIYKEILAVKDWAHYRKSGRWYPYLTKLALHKSLPLRKRRIIIKDPGLSFCLDDAAPLLGDHLGIILMRNPLSIVTSLNKLKWDPIQRLNIIYTHPYFKRYDIHRDNITINKIAQMSPLERMALQTALLHYFLNVQSSNRKNYKIVHFETLMSNPSQEVAALSNELQFSNNYVTQSHLESITSNDQRPITRHSYKRNSKRYIKYWENITNTDECATINYYYNLFNAPYPQ